jgi:tyrosinase
MAKKMAVRERPSLLALQNAYEKGDTKPLETLMRAWKGIKELPPTNPNSFFILGGFHGAPFRGTGATDRNYWGGYCNHGNVLFPTWHRAYLLRLENALRSIPLCENVTLAYWDATDSFSLKNGIPWALTNETFRLDGKLIPNPLRSFVLPADVPDSVSNYEEENNIPLGDGNANYSKPAGYETVRFPLSGLVGTEQDRQETASHNARFPNFEENKRILNGNIVNWLNMDSIPIPIPDVNPYPAAVYNKFKDCLEAPNYTVFSNTTSAAHWNKVKWDKLPMVVPLESPHNSIHLAVGGFDVGNVHMSQILGANGDMGENNTAGLDPIFYFHHCNIDRVFWLWQMRHMATENFDIIADYPGTHASDSDGGPPVGIPENAYLTMDTPLFPFTRVVNGRETYYTSRDCIHIENQLGYRYSVGSLEEVPVPLSRALSEQGQLVRVTGVNRAPIRGSFIIAAFIVIDGKKYHIGTEAILSRWNTEYCKNCQRHIEANAFFNLHGIPDSVLAKASYEILIYGRNGVIDRDVSEAAGGQLLKKTLKSVFMKRKSKFKLEVR